jgi:hypothetical protein
MNDYACNSISLLLSDFISKEHIKAWSFAAVAVYVCRHPGCAADNEMLHVLWFHSRVTRRVTTSRSTTDRINDNGAIRFNIII